MDIQDFGQHGDLEDEKELFGDPGELELPPQVVRGNVAGQDLADAEAVDKFHFLKIQQDVLFANLELFLDQLMKRDIRDVRSLDLPLDVEDHDIVFISPVDHHGFWLPYELFIKRARESQSEFPKIKKLLFSNRGTA